MTFHLPNLQGQFIQEELSAGSQKVSLQANFVGNTGQENNFEIAGVAFFNKFFSPGNEKFDEAAVQSSLFWKLSDFIKIGPDILYSNGAGLQLGFASSLQKNLAGINVIVKPMFTYNELKKAPQGGIMMRMDHSSKLSDEWNLTASGLLIGSWIDFKTHDRTLLKLRVGPHHNGSRFQFGLGYDLDRYGPNKASAGQFSFFIRNSI